MFIKRRSTIIVLFFALIIFYGCGKGSDESGKAALAGSGQQFSDEVRELEELASQSFSNDDYRTALDHYRKLAVMESEYQAEAYFRIARCLSMLAADPDGREMTEALIKSIDLGLNDARKIKKESDFIVLYEHFLDREYIDFYIDGKYPEIADRLSGMESSSAIEKRRFTADLNADGFDDLITVSGFRAAYRGDNFQDSSVAVYYYDLETDLYRLSSVVPFGDSIGPELSLIQVMYDYNLLESLESGHLYLCDLNEDGLSDILFASTENGKLHLVVSAADGYESLFPEENILVVDDDINVVSGRYNLKGMVIGPENQTQNRELQNFFGSHALVMNNMVMFFKEDNEAMEFDIMLYGAGRRTRANSTVAYDHYPFINNTDKPGIRIYNYLWTDENTIMLAISERQLEYEKNKDFKIYYELDYSGDPILNQLFPEKGVNAGAEDMNIYSEKSESSSILGTVPVWHDDYFRGYDDFAYNKNWNVIDRNELDTYNILEREAFSEQSDLEKSWYKIEYENITGWIFTEYVIWPELYMNKLQFDLTGEHQDDW